jgi:hypothetical protein
MISRASLLVAAAATLLFTVTAWSQGSRGATEASIGSKNVDVDYGRPALRGRDMLGKAPIGTIWRTGADTSTTFTTEADVTAGGKTIPAGVYSLFTKRVDEKTWHLIFNTQHGQWGTSHDPSLDFAEAPLNWEQSSTSVEEFTIELSGGPQSGAVKILWGTHVLTLELTAK